eukprot:Transcript_21062.p1 GENE.Transcript_21062~~Transcript_21062.p1  ORF type:complete len:283 (-),score=92.94 Transcript_21062:195-1043(-)
MLFFLSRRYFTSKNCLREIKTSLELDKPLVLVHEQQEDKGGGPLDVIKAECRENEMRTAVFDGRTTIAWHRVSQYQNLTLKLIATEMLRHGRKYRNAPHAGLSRQSSRDSNSEKGGAAPEELSLILPGAPNVFDLVLTKRVNLWCSAGNPGAAEVAQELASAMAVGDSMIEVTDVQPNAAQLARNGESAFMLLYLSKNTWVKDGRLLERDVWAARGGLGRHRSGRRMSAASASSLTIILVHENDPTKGGCEFDVMFESTPQALIDAGIYRSVPSLRTAFRAS